MKDKYDPETQHLMDDYYLQLIQMYRQYHDALLNTSINAASSAWTRPLNQMYPKPTLDESNLIETILRLFLRLIRVLLKRLFHKQIKLPYTMILKSQVFDRAAHEYFMSRYYYWQSYFR